MSNAVYFIEDRYGNVKIGHSVSAATFVTVERGAFNLACPGGGKQATVHVVEQQEIPPAKKALRSVCDEQFAMSWCLAPDKWPTTCPRCIEAAAS